MEPLVIEFAVACSPARAFTIWTADTRRWWPTDHSVSSDPTMEMIYEPRVGGRIYERTADGTEYEWGEVIAWEPPARLVYLWHVSVDGTNATEVEITFGPSGDKTEVTITHTGWERLGADAESRRSRNRAGWAAILPDYINACA